MNELAIQKIMQCLEENLFEPNVGWPKEAFEERSYARWAAIELAEILMDRPYEFPDLIIEEFMFKMDFLARTSGDPKRKRIFSIAKSTAEDILTLF